MILMYFWFKFEKIYFCENGSTLIVRVWELLQKSPDLLQQGFISVFLANFNVIRISDGIFFKYIQRKRKNREKIIIIFPHFKTDMDGVKAK